MNMIRFIFIIFFIILSGCEAEHTTPEESHKGSPFYFTRDTSSFRTGRYAGKMHLVLPGHTDITNFTYMEIFQYEAIYVVRWWSDPDTTATALIQDTLRYLMRYDNTNDNCGLQRTIYDYSVISIRRGDSIHDSGFVRYRWYFNNQLRKDLPGTFVAKLRFIDSKTPGRRKWEN